MEVSLEISTKLILYSLIYIHHCQSHSIDCSGTDQCLNHSLKCPTQEDCMIHCEGKQSCSYAKVICPESQSAKCTVLCTGVHSCVSIRIYAEQSLFLAVKATGKHSLSYSSIYCPSTRVDDDCNITYIGNQSGLNNINIYTTSNYNSINCDCSSIDHCWSNGDNPILHYGDNEYSKQCTIYDSDTCISDNNIINIHSSNNILIVFLILFGALCGIFITICCCVLCLRYCHVDYHQAINGLEMVLKTPMLKSGNPVLMDSYSRSEGKAVENQSILNVINGFEETDGLQPGEFVISNENEQKNDVTPFV